MKPADRAKRTAMVIRLATSGQSTAEIAAELKVKIHVVRYVLRENGVRAVDKTRVDPEAETRAVEAVRAGCSIGEAVATHGVSHGHLTRALRARGVRSTATPSARQDGRTARALVRVRAGMSPTQASAIEGCAVNYLYAVLKRERLAAEAAQREARERLLRRLLLRGLTLHVESAVSAAVDAVNAAADAVEAQQLARLLEP